MSFYPGALVVGTKLLFIANNKIMKELDDGKNPFKFKYYRDGSFYLTPAIYNQKRFPFQAFYEAKNKFKITQITSKVEKGYFIGLSDADIKRWRDGRPGSIAGKVYVSPLKKDRANPYLTIVTDADESKTIGNIDKVRKIDFTEKIKKLDPGNYEIRLYNRENKIVENLVTFTIDGKGNYTEFSNALKMPTSAPVYRLDNRHELICMLPGKYKPKKDHFFCVNCHNGMATIKIDTDGRVILTNQIGTTWNGISLAGISYVVDPLAAMRREYKYHRRGECYGKETIMYSGSWDNKGSWKERIDNCAKKCEDYKFGNKKAPGFVVYPRGKYQGRCFCEAQDAKTCRWAGHSNYYRYNFTE